MRKREWKERPSKHKYINYEGELGRVVGLVDSRSAGGHVQYKVECAFCGEIHLRDAKHLKQNIKPRKDCKNVRVYNYKGYDAKDGYLMRTYGITSAQYDEMLESQDGVCAICGQEEQVKTRGLSVDHCHTTGEIRGLLCSFCNMALGLIKDDTQSLINAVKYLANAR